MKANELMIGDYVIRKNVPNEILIVVAIDSIRDIVYLDLDGLGITEKIENIEPIPIITEILEKNGFVYKEAEKTCATDAFHLWWLDGSLFTLNDDSWWHSIKDGKLRVKFGGFPLKFVHELQHALRLAGIDKTIEL